MKEVCILQGSAVTFSDIVDKFVVAYVKFLQNSAEQELLKSVYFWLSYLKHKRARFLKHDIHRLCLV